MNHKSKKLQWDLEAKMGQVLNYKNKMVNWFNFVSARQHIFMLPVLARPDFPSCSFSMPLRLCILFSLSWVCHVKDHYKSLRRTLQLFISFTSWCCTEWGYLNQVNMEWTWKGAASCTLHLCIYRPFSQNWNIPCMRSRCWHFPPMSR